MKPFYVVLLMGVAALGGGLVVRYSDHPVLITLNRSVPPTVVAPPIPPKAHVGPSNSVPVRTSLGVAPDVTAKPPQAKKEKPSPLGEPIHAGNVDLRSEPITESRIVARVKIPPEPPAVTPIERSTSVTPAPTPVPTPVKVTSPEPSGSKSGDLTLPKSVAAAPEAKHATNNVTGNHATLRSGMLITVRINEALSSNLNSAGDVFSGVLERPLIADGFVIAERGARVRGEVVESVSAGHDGNVVPELAIRLREILASDGQRVHLVSEPWKKAGSGIAAPKSTQNGVYDVALTRNGAAVIRPATSVTFRLDQSVELVERR